jgi:hypothetical protein
LKTAQEQLGFDDELMASLGSSAKLNWSLLQVPELTRIIWLWRKPIPANDQPTPL